MRECSVDGCQRPHHSKGYCATHAARVRRYGTTETQHRKRDSITQTYSLEERLWPRTQVEDRGYSTPCWVYSKLDVRGRYGVVRWQGQMIGVHLAAYRELVRTPEPGEQVHHLCSTKACWRPDHLLALDPTAHKREHNGHRGPVCRAKTCDRTDIRGYGLCSMHYLRAYRAGAFT